MIRTVYLENMSPWGKLILLISLMILSSLFFAFFGLLLGKLYYDVDLITLAGYVSNPQAADAIGFVRLYQLINQIGVFIVPVVAYTLLVDSSFTGYLYLNRKPKLISLLVGGLIIYTILPFNHFLLEINRAIHLPEIFSGIETWMIESEAQAELITKAFLETDSILILSINILIVAVVPAIGEEWLFRGVLLKLFKQITGNFHWAVLITALLFAALHLQFLSIFPRILLGMVLGYMFVFTQNLWVPVFAHFINNASSVLIYYLHYTGILKVSADDFGSTPNTAYIIGSLLITVWLLIIMKNRERAELIE